MITNSDDTPTVNVTIPNSYDVALVRYQRNAGFHFAIKEEFEANGVDVTEEALRRLVDTRAGEEIRHHYGL